VLVLDEVYSLSLSPIRSERIKVLCAKRKGLEDEILIKDEDLYVNIREVASTLVIPRLPVTLFRKMLPVAVALPAFE
jgi:hypothetical protein